MLKAFTNISFCFISDSLLRSAFIPSLRCLLQDMHKVNPEYVPSVEKLIRDTEAKLGKRLTASHSECGLSNAGKVNLKYYNKLF